MTISMSYHAGSNQADLRRALALRGRPPSLPFSRDDAALRFDLTDPRQAGQKQTKSIRWTGHLGMLNPPHLIIPFYRAGINDLLNCNYNSFRVVNRHHVQERFWI